MWGQIFTKYRANMALATAEKLVYIRGNSNVHSSLDELVALELYTVAIICICMHCRGLLGC